MSYAVKYSECRVCGADIPKFLGIRGNLEYSGAPALGAGQEHMVTNVVACRRCGFVYTNPLILTDTAAGYDDPDAYRPSADGVSPEILFRRSLRIVEKFCPRGKILDVGCGRGEFLNAAKESGWQAYGVEASANLAGYAVSRYGLDISPVTLQKAGFADSFFDAVTLNMVLEHMDDPVSEVKQINRVLKHNGALFVEVPNMDSFMLRSASFYFKLRKKDWSPLLSPLHYPYHCYGYNLSSLKYLLKECGFKIKKSFKSDIGLRGMRYGRPAAGFEKFLCRTAACAGGLLGAGDILKVIAVKADGV